MKIQDKLITLYENKHIPSVNITYESGSPLQYKNDFLKIWLIHMEYLNSVGGSPLKNANSTIFNEALNKFMNKHKDVNLFIAKEGNGVVGVLQAGIAPNNQYGFISDLHVLEDYRNYGIGKNLLKNCMEWFNQNNVSEIGLEVAGGNKKALSFYKKNGFNIDMYSLKIKL